MKKFIELLTDQEFDAENGLYNYDARMYDPIIGRFITPDSIVPDQYNPQSLNRYSYCLNNPLIYTDPTGHYYTDDEYMLPEVICRAYGWRDPFRDPLFLWNANLWGLLAGPAIWGYMNNGGGGGVAHVDENPIPGFDYGDSYSLNLLNPDDNLFDSVSRIPFKDSKFIAGGHLVEGDPDHVWGPNGEKLNAEQVAIMIRKHPRYVDGTPVDLFACNAGRTREDGGDPFALQLSRALEVNVRAPNTPAWPRANGTIAFYEEGEGGKPDYSDPGKFIPFTPND